MWLIRGHSVTGQMLELGAQLACRGPLRVIDGGNRFNAYAFNRAAARCLSGTDASAGQTNLAAVLRRTRLARAFTCYQVVTLLEETPVLGVPTLVLDLLATFYDENVSLAESMRLLQICLRQLQRLSAQAPVAVSTRTRTDVRTALGPLLEDRSILLEALEAAASRTWIFEEFVPPEPQMDFFGRI